MKADKVWNGVTVLVLVLLIDLLFNVSGWWQARRREREWQEQADERN